MCLQWCHRQGWLINNDVICGNCDYRAPQSLPTSFACTTCTHREERAGTEGACTLTREVVPLAGRCCHWNVAPNRAIILVLSHAELAPWISGPRGVSGVFDESDTAPDVVVDTQQRVTVNLEELSVPLVYGVPSADWDAALGLDALQPTPALHPPAHQDVEALLEALACIEQGGAALVAALEALLAAVHLDAVVRTAAVWRAYVSSLLELCRERYGTEPIIANLLQRIEKTVCI